MLSPTGRLSYFQFNIFPRAKIEANAHTIQEKRADILARRDLIQHNATLITAFIKA